MGGSLRFDIPPFSSQPGFRGNGARRLSSNHRLALRDVQSLNAQVAGIPAFLPEIPQVRGADLRHKWVDGRGDNHENEIGFRDDRVKLPGKRCERNKLSSLCIAPFLNRSSSLRLTAL